MAEIFKMPKLGMDMDEGVVARWLKAEGDAVKKGEALAEIETDKSCVEVEAPADGIVLKIFCKEDETVPCGTPIAFIGAAGEPIPDITASAAPAEAPAAAPAAAPTAVNTDLFFLMPKLGMDMEEGVVATWLKKEGDTVKKGEALAEIETDKSVVTVESSLDGVVLKIYCPEGESAPCGDAIAAIGPAGTVAPETPVVAAAAAPAAAPAPAAPAAAVNSDLFFLMPKLGMDMEEGVVATWLKKEGETVKKGEALAEIETDKSVVTVEATTEGTLLKIYCPEGESAPCGDPIAAIGPAGTEVPADPKAAVAAAPAAAAVNTDLFFLMPKLGMDMEEGVVAAWLKAEGDTVKKGEALAEIETDKSVVTVEATTEGTLLKIYCPEGESAPCGDPIAAIGPAGTEVPADPKAAMAQPAAPAEAAPAPAAETVVVAKSAAPAAAVAARTPGGRIRATPRACRLAAQRGIDISKIAGTGEEGRIVEFDVQNYKETAPAVEIAAAPAACRVPTETVAPLSGVRKVTARRMMQSLNGSAQTNHRVDVDTTNLMNFRKQVNAKLESQGIKVSIMDILAMACAKALIEHPMANSALMADGLHMRNYANVGIACDTPKGLMVPVIKDADILSITEMAKASRAIINKARNGELKPDDMSGGTFTISNLGMFEIDSFTAVLNPPETCILAVGRIADKVVVENGQMVIRPMMNLCLTYDHQILDGAPAARFLESIKHYIENPVWLVI